MSQQKCIPKFGDCSGEEGGDGDPCCENLTCLDANRKCGHVRYPGETCNDIPYEQVNFCGLPLLAQCDDFEEPLPCDNGLECDLEIGGLCRRLAQLGERCASPVVCAEGLRCDNSDYRCRPSSPAAVAPPTNSPSFAPSLSPSREGSSASASPRPAPVQGVTKCPDGRRCENFSACVERPPPCHGEDEEDIGETVMYGCDCANSDGELKPAHAGLYCEHAATEYCTIFGYSHDDAFCANGGWCRSYVFGEVEAHWWCTCPEGYEGSQCGFFKGAQPPTMIDCAGNPAADQTDPTHLPPLMGPVKQQPSFVEALYQQHFLVVPEARELNETERELFEALVSSYTPFYDSLPGMGSGQINTTCTVTGQSVLKPRTLILDYVIQWTSLYVDVRSYTNDFVLFLNAPSNLLQLTMDLRRTGLTNITDPPSVYKRFPKYNVKKLTPSRAPTPVPTLGPTTGPRPLMTPSRAPTPVPTLGPTTGPRPLSGNAASGNFFQEWSWRRGAGVFGGGLAIIFFVLCARRWRLWRSWLGSKSVSQEKNKDNTEEGCNNDVEMQADLGGDGRSRGSHAFSEPYCLPEACPDGHDINAGREAMRNQLRRHDAEPLPLPLQYLEHCTDDFSHQRRIGGGTFSEVYRAKDMVLHRKFAVKRFRVKLLAKCDVNMGKRTFEREIVALKHFRHPNIARLYAYYMSQELHGTHCLVFELAARGSLYDVLHESNLKGGLLHWTHRISIALDVSMALQYLHKGVSGQSCYHRDIKSSNICIKRDFTALLIDWGVSKMVPEDESQGTMTIMGSAANPALGTPGYMCPDYARKLGRYTSANDVFSLGVVLAELFTGTLQGSEVDGEKIDLYDRYSKDGSKKRQLDLDMDITLTEWTNDTQADFAQLAVECIAQSPGHRPSIEDIARRLENLASKARPWSPDERNHITVLRSDPLVYADDRGNLFPIASSLQFTLEKDLISRCIRETLRDISLTFDVATDDRLQSAVTKRCGCLHFSGHGHPESLVFEDDSGGAHFLGEVELYNVVRASPFKLAFVSACHSSFMGTALVKAGVPHVICCDLDAEIRDDAALKFTRAFYYSLSEGYTVKDAFESGKSAVSNRFDRFEANKFMLIPMNGNHEQSIFCADKLEWTDEGPEEAFSPSPPEHFLGREVAMYHLLKHVLSKKMVTMIGETGVGCSGLAAALCHFIHDRRTTMLSIETIYFVRCRKESNAGFVSLFLEPLHNRLVAEGRAEMLTHVSNVASFTRRIIDCFNRLGRRVLVALDGVDSGDEELLDFLTTLFDSSNKVKILLTAKQGTGFASCGVQEFVYHLNPLDLESTVDLFGRMCPHTGKDPATKSDQLGKLSDQAMQNQDIFERIGGGIPARTIRAARGTSKHEYIDLLGHTR